MDKSAMDNKQCIRCVNRNNRECKDKDKFQLRECKKFVPRTEKTG